MRILVLLVLLLTAGETFSQTQTKLNQNQTAKNIKETYDTLVRFGNRKIPVTRLNEGAIDISYALPEKPDSIIRLPKKEVEKIIFKNGTIRQLNNSLVEVVRADQWQAVLVTKDKADVQGLYLRGETVNRSYRNAKSKNKAIESVYIQLQKFAAAKKATYVLITNFHYEGGYGEIPIYVAEAQIYGPEPLETGTNVVNPKTKTPNKK